MRILLVALVLLSGCASDMHWTGGSGNLADFAKDDYACRKDAVAYGGTAFIPLGSIVAAQPRADMNMYRMCMRAAGYEQTK